VAAPAWASRVSDAIGLFQADTTKTAVFQQTLVDTCLSDGTCKK